MNRRTFIKSAGVAILMVSTPVFAGRIEQQWIKYTDQMPKVGHYIVVLYVYKEVREVCCGRVSISKKDNIFVDFTDANKISNKAASDLGFKSEFAEDCVGAGFTYVDDSVYWIPIKNNLPNRLPKFNLT